MLILGQGLLQQRITIAPRGKRAGSRVRGGRNNLVSEQVMDESRIDRLETKIGSIAAGQDRKFWELQETLMQAITGPRDSTESYGAVIPRVTKLDFPRFNGSEDPTSWICRVEQFFEFQKIAEEEKVPLATYHLEGEAQLWYQILKEEGEVTWLTLKEGLNSRYGPTEFDDFFGDLTMLKQVGSVREYQSQFEKLLSRVGKLNQSQQVACFIGCLKEGVRIDVQAMKPPTLSAAVVTSRPLSSTPAIRRLSPTEMKERRDKGRCFNCDEKFALGHRCKKLFLIEGCWPEEDSGDGIGDIEEKEDNDELEISLHAMAGSPAPQTMQIHGVINQQSLIVLIDSGSTHNFIEERLAEKLGLTCNREERFNVKVACSERISCKGRCIGVQVRIQGVTLDINFYLLPLEGYEVVLGAQWLRTLGMTEWDFSKLLMRFQYGGKRISL
ncbi:hypothetical protein CK203_042670 [Vitis vinifera]|uniref:Ty3 transposon capsid-like protein domain-containing protein n=1 Tax=Vitis vinifera TaxID=29760 RepID=A0A438I735_VITVI|nr:hypothetical protein CK203_042670 [Vitis vinifera]